MKTVAERVKCLEALNESDPRELARELGKALNDRSPTIRGLAIELIGDNKLAEMLPKILPLLDDRDSEVRALAVECIVQLADGDFPVKTIAGRLNDKEELVRIAAAEALAECGDVSALSDLHKALDDKSPLVRSFVAEAIGAIGEKKSVKILEEHLSKEKDARARVGFYIGLHRLQQKDRLADLLNLLRNNDYRVRSAIANSFSILGLSKSESLRVAEALGAAMKVEQTVAARSSIETALKSLRN